MTSLTHSLGDATSGVASSTRVVNGGWTLRETGEKTGEET